MKQIYQILKKAKMFKINDSFNELVKSINDLKNDLKKRLIGKDAILKKIDEKILPSIRNKWEAGQSSKITGGRRKNIKPLAKSTIEYRKTLADNGDLSNLTTPTKSNMISTGETYNQLDSKVNSKSLIIGVKSEKAKLILAENEENGRVILILDENEINMIDRIIDEEIEETLNNFKK